MNFEFSAKTKDYIRRVSAFMDKHIYPNETRFEEEVAQGDRWQPLALMEDLKGQAQSEGLWNLFLPASEHGAGLTNLEYAPLCEIMGRVSWSPEVFNCSAPDTGNMETLERYATEEIKRTWMDPLLREMAAGKSNTAIGESLFLAERSVEKVIHSIFLKLGLEPVATDHRRVLAVLAYLQRAQVSAGGVAGVPGSVEMPSGGKKVTGGAAGRTRRGRRGPSG